MREHKLNAIRRQHDEEMATLAMRIVTVTQQARRAFAEPDRRVIATTLRSVAADIEAVANQLEPDNAPPERTWIEQERYPDVRPSQATPTRSHRRD
jgi:hypothetical protein